MRVILLALCMSGIAGASGHGPVFGFATPTNSQREWSFDLAMAGRNSAAGTQLTTRAMIGYGFTPHLTFSFSAPALLVNDTLPPTRLQSGDDFDATLAWRFRRKAVGVGKRVETTAFGGMMVPGLQTGGGVIGGLKRAPGFNVGIVTGMASRSNYVWLGGAYSRYFQRNGDQRPSVFAYSLVYGHRPESWRKESGFWDWRIFGELTGEASSRAAVSGVRIPGTNAHQIFAGPSMLGIKKNYALSFGAQLPLYRSVGSLLPKERVRFVVNLSYFLFAHHSKD